MIIRASDVMDALKQNKAAFILIITLSMVIYTQGANVTTTSETELIIPPVNPQIYSLHIKSVVTYRFATTHVTSRLANNGETAKEATFSVTLPKTAFIMNFSMLIDGETYSGEVREKAAAKKQYEKAKKKGQSAGHVAAKARDSNVFKVSINVAARSKIDFNLTYQELLQRKLGVYQNLININPGQVVRDMKIEVEIKESRRLTVLRVPPIREDVTQIIDPDNANPLAVIDRISASEAYIVYRPSMEDQLGMSPQGIAGQFIVQYDVERNLDAGEVQVIDGYFVHYIAPQGLEPVNKNVMFVLDVSGSMSGVKLKQTKDAMTTILDDLRPSDVFNIIVFEGLVRFWTNKGAVLATPSNIRKAKDFIAGLEANGGTNINDALLRAIGYLNEIEENPVDRTTRTSLVVFLTDGQPTSGITNHERILENVRHANRDKKVTLFALGFGRGVNFQLLQKISLQNQGIARRIYEDSDASLQLHGFYSEVSTPMMSNIKVRYITDDIDEESMTETDFSAFFQGSEIVVAGRLKNDVNNLQVKVSGGSARGYMSLDMDVRVPKVEKEAAATAASNFTERLWAYLTIRKLMDDMLELTDAADKAEAKAKALELSIRYNFVTPLTSMVVTKPDNKNDEDIDVDDDDEKEQKDSHSRRKPSYSANKRPGSFVDNDPHFIIGIDGIEERVCFDVQGAAGDVYQLVHDKITGIVVNGLIVADLNQSKEKGHTRTYIGKVAIMRKQMHILVTPDRIKIMNKTLSWKLSTTVTVNEVTLFVEAKRAVTIEMERGVVFKILRHKVTKNHPNRVDYLGFYVEQGFMLSEFTHGLLGQFQHQTGRVLTNTGQVDPKSGNLISELTLEGPHMSHRRVTVRLGKRRDMKNNVHVPCWYVRNNGRGLLKGVHVEYVVPYLMYSRSALTQKPNLKFTALNLSRNRR